MNKRLILFVFLQLSILMMITTKKSKKIDNNIYLFTCYNKNKMILSSYGYDYDPSKGTIIDSRDQQLIKLPHDCAIFKFQE